MSLTSTYLRAAIDGGHPQYDLWPTLRALNDTCYGTTYAWIQDAPLVDVREVSYCQVFTALQATLDPDPEQKRKAQQRLVTAYQWIWGPQQRSEGNYVGNLIEGDMSRTFIANHGSSTLTLHRGQPLPQDYCGEDFTKGGTIALAADRVTITGVGTNFTGSAGKVMVLRGSLDGQPWSMTAEIAASPAPTVNRLTLVHPWRGDLSSVSATQWKLYAKSIQNTGVYTMFFGQTASSGEYPYPQVLDEDNWYWCQVADSNTLTLDKPYTGDTSNGNVFRRPSLQNLTGRGSQPFMQGIAAWALNASAVALDDYDGETALLYRTSADRVMDWIFRSGRNPATKGLFYGVDFSNCRNLTILPALECGQNRDSASNERAYNVESNGAVATKYLNWKNTADLSRGDEWFNDQFAREGYANPFPPDGSFAELIDTCCFFYGEKAYGQTFGIGQSHQWPAARLGGVDPAELVAVGVDVDFGSARTARVTVTAPSSVTKQFSCSSSPCEIFLDRRQGAHWVKVELLSEDGEVLSQAQSKWMPIPVR